jgi:hypothetical protein
MPIAVSTWNSIPRHPSLRLDVFHVAAARNRPVEFHFSRLANFDLLGQAPRAPLIPKLAKEGAAM